MMKLIWRIPPLALLALFCWTGYLFADYTLLLKNGRSITVKRYREEGGIIKVYGLGWEMGFSRDQIESIIRVEEGKGQRTVLPDLPVRGLPAQQQAGTQTGAGQSPGKAIGIRQGGEKVAPPGHLVGGEGEEKKDEPVDMKGKAKTPEELRAEERAKEEKKYQKRVREITTQIKTLMDRYFLATKGKTGNEPTILETKEQIQARTAELNSRLRDRQHNRAGSNNPGEIGVISRGPFGDYQTKVLRPRVRRPKVRVPPPAYSPKEKELSKLRAEITKLRKKRDRLIQEMRAKNFFTGF